MQVNSTRNHTSFKSLHIENSAKSLLFSRLDNPDKYLRFSNLVRVEDTNPKDTYIFSHNGKRLSAELANGKIIKENLFASLLRLSPLKFIKNACKESNNTL